MIVFLDTHYIILKFTIRKFGLLTQFVRQKIIKYCRYKIFKDYFCVKEVIGQLFFYMLWNYTFYLLHIMLLVYII